MIISVKGGKFHTLLGEPLRSSATVCGLTVAPVNYFTDAAAVDRHTGGRLSTLMCQHCAKKDALI